jgi:2-oxo-4-hydroxy-4-carboxy-5-ureidoimidazoline decarboxylase
MPFDPLPRNMSRAAFVERFGGVYEHFPQIAEATHDRGLTEREDTAEGLAAAMATTAAGLDEASKLALICNHPDLAGKAAIGGQLTAASKSEQSGAGLADCTADEFRRFQDLNDAYKKKFGFPFILAVGGRNRQQILTAFEQRVANERDAEFRTALAEIDRIAQLRLESMSP